jgi:ribose transport system substrate-binding protein
MTTTDAPPRPRTARKIMLVLVFLIACMWLLWTSGVLEPRPRVALVTAGQGPYWDLVVSGAKDAAARQKLRLDVFRPKSDEPSQSEAIRNLIGKGYAGVAVSPNDRLNQAAVLSELGAETALVTFDSDCAVANRLCFIGTDNYGAGHMAAQHVKQAVPDGGEIIIAIGSLDKENGQRRRQGVIDELLERSFEPQRPMDAVDAELKGSKYTIVATLVDGIDPDKATAMATQALDQYPNAKAFVCLFAYSTPSVLKSLEKANKLGKVQVIGFDAYEETLAGIENGNVFATMMQDPYMIAFEATRILSDAARGNRKELPMFQTFFLPCDPVTKANVGTARDDLARKNKPTTQPASVAASS